MTEATISRRSLNHAALFSAAAALLAPILRAAETAEQKSDGSEGSSRREVIKQSLPGDPPRELTLVEVTYPPGIGSPPHAHANGVMAFVVAGSIVSKVGDAPERTFHAGEAWWEPQGATHRVSRNASSSDPAKLLAIYVAPTGATAGDLMKPL